MQPIPAPTHTLIPPAVTHPTGTFAAQTRRMKAKARDACHSALRPPASSVSLLETRAPSCMHKGRDMTTCSLNMLHLFLFIITVMQLSLECLKWQHQYLCHIQTQTLTPLWRSLHMVLILVSMDIDNNRALIHPIPKKATSSSQKGKSHGMLCTDILAWCAHAGL